MEQNTQPEEFGSTQNNTDTTKAAENNAQGQLKDDQGGKNPPINKKKRRKNKKRNAKAVEINHSDYNDEYNQENIERASSVEHH